MERPYGNHASVSEDFDDAALQVIGCVVDASISVVDRRALCAPMMIEPVSWTVSVELGWFKPVGIEDADEAVTAGENGVTRLFLTGDGSASILDA